MKFCKTEWLIILGIVALLGVVGVFFCELVYEERNPVAITVTKPKVTFKKIEVTVTAFSPSPAQTDSNPFETASGLIVTPQDLNEFLYAAVSWNLLKQFNPNASLEYGDKIYLEFTIIDTMDERWTNRIDLFLRNQKLAELFGSQPRKIIILEE